MCVKLWCNVKMKVLLVIFVSNLFFLGLVDALKENCTSDQDCLMEEKSVCLDNKICDCDPLSKYNKEQAKCVKYATEFGAICYDETQCKPFLGDNSDCLNNICVCADEYRWYQGKCEKYAKKDESCSDKLKCLDPTNPLALTCTDNICQCSDGYYDRGEDCRLISGADGECAINSDCFPSNDTFHVPNVFSHCELGKCIRDANKQSLISLHSFIDSDYYSEIIPVDAEEPNNTACSGGVSTNLPKGECENCPNTFHFLNSACICKPGFFLDNGKCVAELGMLDETTSYSTDLDCPIKPGKLVEGVCYCKNYWFQDRTNRECKKTTLQYTQNCMDNDWCKAMGEYAFCNSETGKCQCISQAVLNETTFYCDLKEDYNLTGICLSDSDCALYETCLDEKCQCTDGFYRINDSGLCLPKIGHSCEVRDCSHIDNAVCKNEVCDCNGDGDEYVTDGLICVKVASKLNEECQIAQQCKNITFSACKNESNTSKNVTTRCLCIDEYLDVNDTCHAIKYPGSLCSTKSDCTIILGDTFECRNMLCQCPIGKTLSKGNICLSSSGTMRTFSAVLIVVLSGVLIRMQ